MKLRASVALLLAAAIAAPASAGSRHSRGGARSDQAPARHARQVPPPVDTNVVELQARLDRAGFSVGEIDGNMGHNTTRAVTATMVRAGTRVPFQP